MITYRYRVIEHSQRTIGPDSDKRSVLYYTVQRRSLLWDKIPCWLWTTIGIHNYYTRACSSTLIITRYAYRDAACLAIEELKKVDATIVEHSQKVVLCGGNENG